MAISYERKLTADERRRKFHDGCRHIQWGDLLQMCPSLGLLVCHECYEHFALDHIRHECTER